MLGHFAFRDIECSIISRTLNSLPSLTTYLLQATESFYVATWQCKAGSWPRNEGLLASDSTGITYYVCIPDEEHLKQGFIQDFELGGGGGGKQDGSKMIVARESTLTHTISVPTRGVWGHLPLPQKNFEF